MIDTFAFTPGTALRNDNSEHREALIAALKNEGLSAFEYHSGGGLHHVCVYLVADKKDWLAVATGSGETECDLGLMGDREQFQVGDEFEQHPRTLAEVVIGFAGFWQNREIWIGKYRAGELDYKQT